MKASLPRHRLRHTVDKRLLCCDLLLCKTSRNKRAGFLRQKYNSSNSPIKVIEIEKQAKRYVHGTGGTCRRRGDGNALSTRKMQIKRNGVDACSNALRQSQEDGVSWSLIFYTASLNGDRRMIGRAS